MKKIIVAILSLALLLSTTYFAVIPAAAASKVALPASSSILVDGVQTSFQAYTVGNSNYFKLRDIAMVLSGTGKQFAVDYDNTANAIVLRTGQPYIPAGGELTFSGNTGKAYAEVSSQKVILDGTLVTLGAYVIGGYNYFKLRDLGTAINFGVGWDGGSNTITIDTKHEYNVGFFDPTIDYASQQRYKIAYVTGNSAVLYEMLSVEFADWAKRMNCTYSAYSIDGDIDLYIDTLQALANLGVDGFILDPDIFAYQRVTELMNELDLPWMSGLSAMEDDNGNLLHPAVVFDNIGFGAQMAAWDIAYAQKNWPGAADNQIGMISLDFSVSPAIHQRSIGAQSVWNQNYPGQSSHFFIADGWPDGTLDVDTAYELVGTIIAANPGIKYWLICSLFDDYAVGAARAAEAAGMENTCVVTCVGGSSLINQWDAGKTSSWKSAVFISLALQAEPIFNGLYAMMSGRATPDTLFLAWINKKAGDTYATVSIQDQIITQDNYKEYLEWIDAYTGFNEFSYAYQGAQFPLRVIPPASYNS